MKRAIMVMAAVAVMACKPTPPSDADAQEAADAAASVDATEARPIGALRSTSGAGRVAGGTMTIEVEVGHGVAQGITERGAVRVQGGPL